VIRAILDTIDFKDDYKVLANALFPSIPPKRQRNPFFCWKNLGLIVKDEKGFWRPSDKSIASSDYLKDELIFNYQMQCLDLAKQALMKRHGGQQNISTNI